jgi:hypothetical protein
VESEEKDCICDIDEPEPVDPDIPMEDIPVEEVPIEDIPVDPIPIDPIVPEDRAELPSIEPEESMELPSEESEDWPWAYSVEEIVRIPRTKGTSRRIRIILFSCTIRRCNKLFVKNAVIVAPG